MVETTPPTGGSDGISTRDWIKGVLVVGIVVAVVIILFAAAIGQFCGCGTRPA